MIKKLKLFNIGGVSEAELNLAAGLNVITGESGAGKSSVVSALELLAGQRGNSQIIKSGETQGSAEAELITSLNFYDLDEDLRPLNSKLNLKRVILNSRSYSSLQGVRVPLSEYSKAFTFKASLPSLNCLIIINSLTCWTCVLKAILN